MPTQEQGSRKTTILSVLKICRDMGLSNCIFSLPFHTTKNNVKSSRQKLELKLERRLSWGITRTLCKCFSLLPAIQIRHSHLPTAARDTHVLAPCASRAHSPSPKQQHSPDTCTCRTPARLHPVHQCSEMLNSSTWVTQMCAHVRFTDIWHTCGSYSEMFWN